MHYCIFSSFYVLTGFTHSWTDLPDLHTARAYSAAVYIPSLGVLVVGGDDKAGEALRSVELLRSITSGGRILRGWEEIDPLVKPRSCVSAAYHEQSVFVASIHDDTVEMLPILDDRPGQWTLLSGFTTPSDRPFSMCTFNGRLFLAGELALM